MIRRYYETRMSQQDALKGGCRPGTFFKVWSIISGVLLLAVVVEIVCIYAR